MTCYCLMLPTFFLFKPSEPAKSVSLSKCPVFPTNALLFKELAPSAHFDAIV